MKTWKLTDNNDIELTGANDIAWISEDDEIAQAIKVRIFTNLGEWFLNLDMGFERMTILGKRPDLIRATEAINRAIMFDNRIRSVEDIQIDLYRENRLATITFVAKKQDGTLLESEVFV